MGIILKLSLLSNRKIIQNVPNKIVPNPCMTLDNTVCVFPFKYNDVEYYKCTYASSRESCVFPFRYQGIVYNKCADVSITGIDNNQAWCATEVTSGGEHIDGKVAVCPNTCSGAESNTATD